MKNMVSEHLQKYINYMRRIGMAFARGNPAFQNYLRSLKDSTNMGVKVL